MSEELSFVFNDCLYSGWTEADALAANVPPQVIAQAKAAAARQRLAARRYQAEIAGTTWTDANGVAHPVATDRQSQSLVMGALLASTLPGFAGLNWKMADGTFVALAAADIASLAQAVRAHVQGCFDREAELAPQVDADPTTDIESGWPA
jgi:hypothetical protein